MPSTYKRSGAKPMTLMKDLEASGNSLFRSRGFPALFLIVLFFLALPYFNYPLASHYLDQIREIVCLGISVLGLFVRIMTVGYTSKKTSSRRGKEGPIADRLNTTGMYSIVRNPLYLGNFIIGLGISLFLGVWYVSVIYILLFALYYERIIFAEEMFLRRKFGQQYIDWVSKTPIFFPKFRQWRTPDMPFSLKKVLRNEYHGFFGIVIGMFVLEVASDIYLQHCFKFDLMWRYIVSLSMIVYATLRFLHKKTSLLKTD